MLTTFSLWYLLTLTLTLAFPESQIRRMLRGGGGDRGCGNDCDDCDDDTNDGWIVGVVFGAIFFFIACSACYNFWKLYEEMKLREAKCLSCQQAGHQLCKRTGLDMYIIIKVIYRIMKPGCVTNAMHA